MKQDFKKLAISLVLTLSIGYLGSLFTTSQIQSWYVSLLKPALTPPNSVFGPVWTFLYILMAIALYLVWNSKQKFKLKKASLLIFGIQLILNLVWSVLFFDRHWTGIALIEIVVLWLAIFLTIREFRKFSVTSSLLLIPYLLWVSFATYLTAGVWFLNR